MDETINIRTAGDLIDFLARYDRDIPVCGLFGDPLIAYEDEHHDVLPGRRVICLGEADK